jgi:hypothetical protein
MSGFAMPSTFDAGEFDACGQAPPGQEYLLLQALGMLNQDVLTGILEQNGYDKQLDLSDHLELFRLAVMARQLGGKEITGLRRVLAGRIEVLDNLMRDMASGQQRE